MTTEPEKQISEETLDKGTKIEKDRIKHYLEDFAFPLLGISDKEIKSYTDIEYSKLEQSGAQSYKKIDDNKYEINIGHVCVKITFKNPIIDEHLFSNLVYSYKATFKKHNLKLDSLKYRNALYDYAISRGISRWILGSSKAEEINKVEKLFVALDKWKDKTYEGHNVCFGIVIDQEAQIFAEENDQKIYGDFISFFEDEYSAVLTDGISSVFQLDRNCNLIKYRSLTEAGEVSSYSPAYTQPYRFAQSMTQFTEGNKVGLYLLTNGDLIVAKNTKLQFIRRNGKWLNFSFEAFKAAISRNVEVESELIESIYATMIDISLTHSGGIIAVVEKNNDKWIADSIVDELDKLYSDNDISKMFNKRTEINSDDNSLDPEEKNYNKRKKEHDVRKRITKLIFLRRIIGDEKQYKKIDRKLRSEISALDGACIMDTSGEIIAIGAIIKNKPGSSGGGRGAAARTLSQYGGFAIKISTDGYIEMYQDENEIYQIK